MNESVKKEEFNRPVTQLGKDAPVPGDSGKTDIAHASIVPLSSQRVDVGQTKYSLQGLIAEHANRLRDIRLRREETMRQCEALVIRERELKAAEAKVHFELTELRSSFRRLEDAEH